MSPKTSRPSVPHPSFLDGDAPEAIEHGERPAVEREESLVGTTGTHGAEPDLRAEEPCGELGAGTGEAGGT